MSTKGFFVFVGVIIIINEPPNPFVWNDGKCLIFWLGACLIIWPIQIMADSIRELRKK